jgi:uncharacterized protein YndB with AHSA1/START domain
MTDPLSRLVGGPGRQVLAAGDRRAVRMTRRFDCPVADLWSAWTAPERTVRWLGELRGDRRVGGAVQLVMSPPDADIATLTVLVCEAPSHLRVRWSWPGEPDSIVDLRFTPEGDGTVLLLEHLALTSPTAPQYGAGWEEFTRRLAEHVGAAEPAEPAATDDGAWRALAAAPTVDDRWPTLAGGTITTGLVLAADVATVWDALTRVERLSEWFGPTTGDLQVGGEWVVAWDGGPARGTVTECEPGARFVTTWRFDHEPDLPAGQVTVTVRAVEGGTRLDLAHVGADGNPVGYGAGWYAHLQVLGASLGAPAVDWDVAWETARTVIRPG